MPPLNHYISPSSLEKQIQEEEVKFNEALKMDAEFNVLKSIKEKIRELKAEFKKTEYLKQKQDLH